MNKIKYNNKTQHGITLIALVVTIVVLLILAVVSIKLLINNGIIGKTEDAKILTQLSQVDEAIKLYKSDLAMEALNGDITDDNLIEKEILKEYVIEETLRPIAVIVDYNKLNINSKFGEGYTEINEYTVEGENTPYIATNNELNNVCAIDLTTHTLYYIKDGRVWSLEGNNDILNNYKRVNAGEGEWTFNSSTKTLTAYNGDLTTIRGEQAVGEIIIPNYYEGTRVKAIGGSIFSGNTDIIKLTISEGIQTIGTNAFVNCNNLTGDLIIPDSVVTIDIDAFHGCTSLDGKLKLSKNLERIGRSAFHNCTKLGGNVVIGNKVTTIEGGAFNNCQSLESLTIEEGCTGSLNPASGYGAFQNCTGLKGKIVIPSTFGDIGANSFYGCTGIEGIEIKSTKITTIGTSAFVNCNNLTGDLIIPDSVVTIGIDAFHGCTSLDGKLKLSKNLERIGRSAFHNCTKLGGNVVIGNKVTTIEGGAFNNCQSLESLTIEEGCTGSLNPASGYGAFQNCTGLKGKIVIPSTFGDIGANSFAGCTGIEKIEIRNKDCTIYDSAYAFYSGIKLGGYAGSTAEEYATKYNRTFEVIQ